MADSWTLGWDTADNGSPVTGGAKWNVLTARAGGLDRIIDEVAHRAAKHAAKDMLARIPEGAWPWLGRFRSGSPGGALVG